MTHIDELEWQRQERARLEERADGAAADSNSSVLRYRVVARELARDPDAPLPSNFAYAISARIEADARRQRLERKRFERAAFAWLIAVCGTGGCIALAIYGGDWWSAVSGAEWLNSPNAPWLIAVAGCALLSRLLDGRVRSAGRVKH